MRAKVDERNGATRGTWYWRLWTMNLETWFVLHVVFFCLMIFMICHNVLAAKDRLEIVSRALFPGLGFEQLPAFLTLLSYALSPPTDAPRRSLMKEDEYGVWRPAPEARGGKWSAWIYLLEVPQDIATLWAFAAIFLFV